jgi:hypothetical protein
MKFKEFYSLALENTSSKEKFLSRSEDPDHTLGFEKFVWDRNEINSSPYHNFEVYDIKEGLPEEAEPWGILQKTRDLAAWTKVKSYYLTCEDDMPRHETQTGPMHWAATTFHMPDDRYGKDFPPYIFYFAHYDRDTNQPVWKQISFHPNFAGQLDKMMNWWIKNKEKGFVTAQGLEGGAKGTWEDILS